MLRISFPFCSNRVVQLVTLCKNFVTLEGCQSLLSSPKFIAYTDSIVCDGTFKLIGEFIFITRVLRINTEKS